MLEYKVKENSSFGLDKLLNDLGYIKQISNSFSRLGKSDIKEKAVKRFEKKNKEYLNFLDIKINNFKLISSKKAGIVPLEFAFDRGERSYLIIEPMINWQTLSNFASTTKSRNWLVVNEDWQISKALDIELWYFCKPFLKETVSVLKRPGKGFKKKITEDNAPKGNTDWLDFSVRKFPYALPGFKNTTSINTLDVLPHALIKWTVEAISKSMQNINNVPTDILDDLNQIRNIIDSKVLTEIPSRKNIMQLPRSGAWAGYTNIYNEIEHLATLAGVLNNDLTKGCAYSIQTELLFEEFTMYLCEQFSLKNGFHFYKDTNDSSRIGLNKFEDSSNFRMLSSLKPDIVMTSEDTIIVIDAKYKRHYDLASRFVNSNKEFDWDNDMRHDLHQVVSYSIFSEKKKKILLLTHPKTWSSEKFHVRKNSRNKNILIGYLPINFEKYSDINSTLTEYSNNLKEIITNFA
jgi:5-methylcytosine-specific restriction endonuclease McrBC regulatory subunit McrC